MTNNLDAHLAAYRGENLYDFDNEILLKWYPQRIVVMSEGAKSLLELGLGYGFTTNIFASTFARHVVLDGSPAVINHFREKYPECGSQIIETYFEEFHTEEKFDVIVMGFILEHVDDPIRILKHFRDFMALDGRLFLAVPNGESLNRRLGHLAGLLPDVLKLSEHDLLLGHKRYYTVDLLRKEVEDAGYSIKHLEGIYLKPLTTSQLISLNLDDKIIRALCLAAIDYPELSCGILAELGVLAE
jgi:2-polyprenyl-3-methyl-5-hydroxy-6-metoxy-1,4-benzoquinol methylase